MANNLEKACRVSRRAFIIGGLGLLATAPLAFAEDLEEGLPVEEALPVEEDLPIEEALPAEEDLLVEEALPAEEALAEEGLAEEALVEESVSGKPLDRRKVYNDLVDEFGEELGTDIEEPDTSDYLTDFCATSMKVHFFAPTLEEYMIQDCIVIELLDDAGEKRFVLVDGGFGPETGNRFDATVFDTHRTYVNHYRTSFSASKVAKSASDTLAYIESLGVNDTNVLFYLGTHPHYDHMGCSAELITAYKPRYVYTPEYSDDYLLADSTRYKNIYGQWVTGYNLYDNQLNYDRATYAASLVGATTITSIDNEADATFELCGVTFTIVNWDSDYRTRKGNKRMTDPNDFSWGLIVEAFGRKVFLGGDINNNFGSETHITDWVKRTYGQGARFDLFKLNHHGISGSNTSSLLNALNPRITIGTTINSYPKTGLLSSLEGLGTRLFTTNDVHLRGMKALIVRLTPYEVTTNFDGLAQGRETSGGNMLYYDGRRIVGRGWHRYNGNFYWIDNGLYHTGWYTPNGVMYYFKTTGEVKLGWVNYNGKKRYLDHTSNKIWWLKSTIQTIDGVKYGFDANANMVAGTALKYNGKYYYFKSSGAMVTGTAVKSNNGNYYYFGSSGAMVKNTAVKSKNGKYYYFGSTGAMVKYTWVRSNNGKSYYFGWDGAMVN